jgi:hypothetical protein
MGIGEITDTAATLDAMAATAATTYYEHAVKYGVSRYPRNGFRKTRNWPRFMQIARICLTHKIPVEVFVSAAFMKTLSRHPMVTVADICAFSPDNLLQKQPDGAPCPQDMWNMLSCKLLDMVFALDGAKDAQELLDSSMYGFPAWFRVFSPDKPPEDIIAHWGDLAYEEMSENPKLDEYLKAKRPDTYKLLKSVISNI